MSATSPAAPNRMYSFWSFSRANSIEVIVSHGGDDQRHDRAEREAAGPERPARVDVAEVVGTEVDAGETDQRRQHEPGRDEGGAAGHARSQAEDDRQCSPDVEGRVGGVDARERRARGVD